MVYFLNWLKKYVLYLAWIQAIVAFLGSLFSSQVLNLTPCVLCWYQRILMYPLVLILAVGILKKDRFLAWYVLPLSLLGMGFAAFHYALQEGIIAEQLAPCQIGVSCITIQLKLLGFMTIPLLSFIAFSVITACMLIFIKYNSKNESRG